VFLNRQRRFGDMPTTTTQHFAAFAAATQTLAAEAATQNIR
jgi:hypothetical protein